MAGEGGFGWTDCNQSALVQYLTAKTGDSVGSVVVVLVALSPSYTSGPKVATLLMVMIVTPIWD